MVHTVILCNQAQRHTMNADFRKGHGPKTVNSKASPSPTPKKICNIMTNLRPLFAFIHDPEHLLFSENGGKLSNRTSSLRKCNALYRARSVHQLASLVALTLQRFECQSENCVPSMAFGEYALFRSSDPSALPYLQPTAQIHSAMRSASAESPKM